MTEISREYLIKDFTHYLATSHAFSTLNLAKAYDQISVALEDITNTTMSTRLRLFRVQTDDF